MTLHPLEEFKQKIDIIMKENDHALRRKEMDDEPEAEDEKVWPCPHIGDFYDGKPKWSFNDGIAERRGIDHWNICPVCLAKRPEPEKPKELWEVLEEIDNKTRYGISTVDYKALASAAERWFRERKD